MKVEVCILFVLITIASSIPVPDEEISGVARSAAPEISEKKSNLIEDDGKIKSTSGETKEEKKLPESAQPEFKKLSEDEKDGKPIVKEGAEQPAIGESAKNEPIQRKLDEIPAPSATSIEGKSAPEDEQVIVESEIKSLPSETKAEPLAAEEAAAPAIVDTVAAAVEPELERKAEILPEPLAAEGKEIKDEQPELEQSAAAVAPASADKKISIKSDEKNDEHKSEELKSDEQRKEKSDSEKSVEDASGPLEEPIVAAVASKSASAVPSESEAREAVPSAVASGEPVPAAAGVSGEQVARASSAIDAESVAAVSTSNAADDVIVLPEEPKAVVSGKKIDNNSSESQESDEKHDDASKESSESDEDKSSA